MYTSSVIELYYLPRNGRTTGNKITGRRICLLKNDAPTQCEGVDSDNEDDDCCYCMLGRVVNTDWLNGLAHSRCGGILQLQLYHICEHNKKVYNVLRVVELRQ